MHLDKSRKRHRPSFRSHSSQFTVLECEWMAVPDSEKWCAPGEDGMDEGISTPRLSSSAKFIKES